MSPRINLKTGFLLSRKFHAFVASAVDSQNGADLGIVSQKETLL